jgi:hypothetical protein
MRSIPIIRTVRGVGEDCCRVRGKPNNSFAIYGTFYAVIGISSLRWVFCLRFPQYYIFNHVPKTGGNSLLAVFRHNLCETEISPHLWEQDLADGRQGQFEHYRLVRGHFSINAQKGFARDRYSITLLRHPIRMITSAYHFWRASPDQPDKDTRVMMAKVLSFSEFVRYFADSPVIHDPYAHHFAVAGAPKDTPCPREEDTLLEMAKYNLAAFDFVGITEQFSASVSLLFEDLGWKCPATMPWENGSASEHLFDRIDPKTMDLLMERNRLDLELYEYGKMLFRQHCAQRNPDIHNPAPSNHLANRTRIFVQSRQRITESNRFLSLPAEPMPARIAAIQWVSAVREPVEGAGKLNIAIGFRTEAKIENLVAGILITDMEKNCIWSTNTQIEKLEVKNGPNCNCSISFNLECDIPAGLYFVTVAVHDLRRFGFHYHWIDRATRFQVIGNGPEHTTAGGIRLRGFQSTIE